MSKTKWIVVLPFFFVGLAPVVYAFDARLAGTVILALGASLLLAVGWTLLPPYEGGDRDV